MSSREERQQEQLRRNEEAAKAAERSASQPGGGINQPQYQAPRGGPTWADTPAGRELRKQYEQSGVVFDSRGNIIYNPADLGSAEVEAARAARGLPPSYKTGGDVSPTYAASVYKESRRTASAARSKLGELNAERATTQANIAAAKQKIAEAKQQQNALLSGGGDPARQGQQAANLFSTIRANEMAVANYEAQLKSIDSARSQVANVERQAKIETVKSAFALSSDRTTSGPVDTARISGMGTYQPVGAEGAEPQRQRKQVTSGVKEKLYANPTFMQDAENYTRPPAFLGDVRKERPKIQQGVESKLFINPTYVTKQEQREIDKTKRSAFGISLVETIGTERGPQTFAISLNEGAPSKPRELTQDEVNNLTPQQYAVYRAEIDAYNKYIEDYNKQQKELFRQAKQQNLLQWKQSKTELLTDIAELKRKGVTTISAMTSEGPKDIPINNAFKELTSGKIGGATITGLGIAPNIPEGYALVGSLSNQILLPEQKIIQQDKAGIIKEYSQVKDVTGKPREPDILEATLKKWSELKTDNPFLSQAAKPFYQEFLGGAVGLVNLERMGQKLVKPNEPISLSNIPKATASGEFAGGVFASGKEAIEKGNIKYFTGGLAKSAKSAGELAKEQGPIATSFGLAGFLFPVGIGAAKSLVSKTAALVKTAPKLLAESGAKTVSSTLAKREGSKILQSIRAYPGSKLRNQGYEPIPEIKTPFTPKEESAIKKAFQIPEARIAEIGTKGARLAERPRDILESIPQKIISKKETPVSSDPFYDPAQSIERTRSSEISKNVTPRIYKVEAAKYLKGENPLKEIFSRAAPPSVQDFTGYGKKPTLPNLTKLEESERIRKLEAERLGTKVNPVEPDLGYRPSLPKTRAEKIKTYRIQKEQVFGKTVDPIRELLSRTMAKSKPPSVQDFTGYRKKPTLPNLTKLEEAERIRNLEAERLGTKVNPVEPDLGYRPSLPRTRAEKIKTYRIQKEQVFGKTVDPIRELLSRTMAKSKPPSVQDFTGYGKKPIVANTSSLEKTERIINLQDKRLQGQLGKTPYSVRSLLGESIGKTKPSVQIPESYAKRPRLPTTSKLEEAERIRKLEAERIKSLRKIRGDLAPSEKTNAQRVIQIMKPKRKLTPQEIRRGEVPDFAKNITMVQKPKRRLSPAEIRRGEIEGDWRRRALDTPVLKSAVIGANGGGIPAIGSAIAENAPNIPSGAGNVSSTNQTSPPDEVAIPELDVTQSPFEPQTISQRRPEVIGVITGGVTSTKPIQRYMPKVDSSFRTSVRQSASQRVQPSLRSSVITSPMLSERLGQKQPQKQAQLFRQSFPTPSRAIPRFDTAFKFEQKQKQLLRLKPIRPKKPRTVLIPVWPDRKEKKEKRAKEEEKGLRSFIGNTRVTEVEGIFGKRNELTYGEQRTAKLAMSDVRFSSKGSLVSGKRKGMLKAPRRYFTPTDRQSKNFLKL